MFSWLNERAIGVTQEIHGKQFMQPEIDAQVEEWQRSQGMYQKLQDMMTNSKSLLLLLGAADASHTNHLLVSESQIIPARLYSDVLSMC